MDFSYLIYRIRGESAGVLFIFEDGALFEFCPIPLYHHGYGRYINFIFGPSLILSSTVSINQFRFLYSLCLDKKWLEWHVKNQDTEMIICKMYVIFRPIQQDLWKDIILVLELHYWSDLLS